jgi:hypothetical protein
MIFLKDIAPAKGSSQRSSSASGKIVLCSLGSLGSGSSSSEEEDSLSQPLPAKGPTNVSECLSKFEITVECRLSIKYSYLYLLILALFACQCSEGGNNGHRKI